MQLAYDHVERMLDTHHIESFKKIAIPTYNRIEHRRIEIKWLLGPLSFGMPSSLLHFKDQGYRCIDVVVNGLSSSLRLVKGPITAEEELCYKLESRSFLTFNHQGNTIQIKFADRTEDELCKYEKEKLNFLKIIRGLLNCL